MHTCTYCIHDVQCKTHKSEASSENRAATWCCKTHKSEASSENRAATRYCKAQIVLTSNNHMYHEQMVSDIVDL